MARQQRPSAALVLGVLAGILASITYLPTIVPLTLRLVDAEGAIALRHTSSAAASAGRWLDAGIVLTSSAVKDLDVHALVVHTDDGLPLYEMGHALPDEVVLAVCATGTSDLLNVDGDVWAVSCLRTPRHQVVTGYQPTFTSGTDMLYLIVALALIVGIITALGILSLLQPLSQVTRALARVGAGERGVRIGTTGLGELDELAERLNAAARAMEDREDAITARIQVVQEMARLVAHEIRNPLQSLELLTTLVATEEDATERHELASSIHIEIRTLDRVVDRLLKEGASRGALRLQKTVQAVAPLVEQVASLRRPEASSRGIRLTLGLMSWRPAPIDSTLLGRSIENLVLNAMQAVSPGAGEVRISVYEEPPWLCFAVDDNGPGIDPKFRDHIFEANVTTKASGTGLGLTLVKGVVEAHGGYIECGPSALGGARFVARIPFEDRDGDQVEQSEPSEDPGRR